MTNTQIFKRELQKRIANGTVTEDDLKLLRVSARRTGLIEDRILYDRARQAFVEQEEVFQAEAKQSVATLDKAENNTESVEEMRALLQKVEKMTQGKDDAQSQQMLSDTRKRYAITRILNDLPAEETVDENPVNA